MLNIEFYLVYSNLFHIFVLSKLKNNIMDRLEFLNNELGTNFMSLDKINWDYISEHQILSEKFIREFQDKIDWDYVSCYQKLSENFIYEFQNKVNWNCISIYQKLSEEFIRKFQNKVNWYYIIKYQELSNDFTEMLNSAIKIGISSFT